jgi:hypothetical protein
MKEHSRISVFPLEIVARGGQKHEQFPAPAVEEQAANFSARLYAGEKSRHFARSERAASFTKTR